MKSKRKIPSIYEVNKSLKKGTLLPIYFLCGEDSYGIENTTRKIETAISPFIASDFDKETFFGSEKSLTEVLEFALAFPFGSGKKLIIVKEFEKVKDKKQLTSYINLPAEFTVLVLIHNGKLSNVESEPYLSLLNSSFLYESKFLKSEDLVEWLIEYAAERNKILTIENSRLLLDLIGENRSLLEMQLDKIITFIGDASEISFNEIRLVADSLKEHNIFDLQNALGRKDKAKSIEIAYNLLDKGTQPLAIVTMLTKYFSGLLQLTEMIEKKIPDQKAASIIGTHPFYLPQYKAAKKIYSEENLFRAARALLQADITLKSTSADPKTVIAIMLTEILG